MPDMKKIEELDENADEIDFDDDDDEIPEIGLNFKIIIFLISKEKGLIFRRQ